MKKTNISIVAWRTLGQGSRVNLKLRERASRKSFAKELRERVSEDIRCESAVKA
jgi:hypothetical protein